MPRRAIVDPRFPAMLQSLRTARGWSQKQLAAAAYISRSHISELESGIKTPSRATVDALDRTLDGGGKLTELVQEAGSSRLDEQSLADRSLRYPFHEADTINLILEMGRADVKRRSILAAPFIAAALAGPSRDWLLASLDEITDGGSPRQIGMKQVSGIRHMFAVFQELDVMRGGGHARVALVEYINSYVIPLLQRDHGNEHVQLALYEAAAEQAYLVGWMAYDDGLHGLAERYLIQSLRLAQASGNRSLGAHVLAGMSDQVNLLGDPKEALALARAGQRAVTIDESPACLADLQILEARALASMGEALAAAQAVARAERTFEQVVRANEPEWARFIDAAYVFGEAALCFRDVADPEQVSRFATESAQEAARQQRARRGALSNAALAAALLTTGNVEGAAQTGSRVVDLTATVDSTRCVQTVRDLSERLRPYSGLHEVAVFREHAHGQLGIA